MKTIIRTIVIVCGLFFVAREACAQPPPPPPPNPLSGTDAPIDEDIVILLIIASAFGAGKIHTAKTP